MKIRFVPKRKLKAATTAARRMPRGGEDYGQEPNISFGRAITVVVVLHLVALVGICVFSGLKARNTAQQKAATAANASASQPAATGTTSNANAAAQETQPRGAASIAPTATPVKQMTAISSGDQPSKPPVNEFGAAVKDSGTMYTVARGDTPVSIAKKLHVGYDDLLKLNKITDPKKLKIGQKLRIPVKKKTTSTTQAPPTEDPDNSNGSFVIQRLPKNVT